MADKSSIEWTDATWPIVQGCDYESPGCTHCYAVPLLWRMAHNPNPAISGPLQGVVAKNAAGKLHFTGKVALREDRLDWPLKWKEPRQIFVPSHGDLFHPSVPDWFIDKVFAVMALCPQHTFQVLTKRSKRMREYLSTPDVAARVWKAANEIPDCSERLYLRALGMNGGDWGGATPWPLRNVWAGVSTEDQPRADERIPDLRATPAAVRFISAEPLLGPLDIAEHLIGEEEHGIDMSREVGGRVGACTGWIPPLDWVIAGGESGPRSRPMHPDWVRSLRDQCATARVPFFFKQWGNWREAQEGDEFDTSRGRASKPPAFIVKPDDGTVHCFMPPNPDPRCRVMLEVGKKAAGATLDGREHREFPA